MVFPYISQIQVNNCYAYQNFLIPEQPLDKFKHLVLSGHNGAGKTTLLNRVFMLLTQMALGKVRTREILNRQIWIRDNPDDQRVSQWTHEISELNDIAIAYLGDESVLQRNGDSQIIAHYKTDRKVALNQVGEVNQSATLLDLLTRILHTSFDNNQLTFDQLSAGHSAFLHIMIDLFVRTEQIRKALEDNTFNPAGIVIIDEPEIHLHLSVQSQILPLLSQQFPNIQFIVATHSPAIIASLENAVVYDVGTKKEVSD